MSWLKLRYEVLLISVARRILKGRNIARCQHVSRRDNNAMWSMAEQLESIEKDMLTKYENV